MGSGDWLRTIIAMKRVRPSKPKNSKGQSLKAEEINRSKSKEPGVNPIHSINVPRVLDEITAATRIQTAFRGHLARDRFQLLKCENRLKIFYHGYTARGQAASALKYLQSWNKIQSAMSSRRRSSMFERRIMEKKPGAKPLNPEVDWCGGPGTREEIFARTRQREEAVAKRERAMAYAFAHQWKINSGGKQGQLTYEQGEELWSWSWSWSWTDRRPATPEKASPAKKGSKIRRRTASAPAKSVEAPA